MWVLRQVGTSPWGLFDGHLADNFLFNHLLVCWGRAGFKDEFIHALKSRGHNVSMFDINVGVSEVQAVIRHENGTLTGASDSRKNGRAWGY